MNEIKSNLKRDTPCANCGLRKLEIAVFVCTALLIGVSIFSMIGLKELQRNKYRHAVDALAVNDGIDICVELIRLVSEAEHGRNSENIKTNWASTKRKLLEVVGNLQAAAEADDRRRMVEADGALHVFIYSFERRMSVRYGESASRQVRDALPKTCPASRASISEAHCAV